MARNTEYFIVKYNFVFLKLQFSESFRQVATLHAIISGVSWLREAQTKPGATPDVALMVKRNVLERPILRAAPWPWLHPVSASRPDHHIVISVWLRWPAGCFVS